MLRMGQHARAIWRRAAVSSLAGLASVGIFYGAAVQAATYSIANDPLFLVTNIPPNLTLTLDDSGSMAWGYVPDAAASVMNSADPRGKSSDWNGMYYDPNVTYQPPVDANGSPLTTSFTHAYINGFDTSRGYRNLSNNYRPTSSYNPSSTGQSLRAQSVQSADERRSSLLLCLHP